MPRRAQTGRRPDTFREQRGEEERLAGVVEALAAGAVGGQEAAEIGLHVEQVANGRGVFFPVQAADRRAAGDRPRAADRGPNGRICPSKKGLAVGKSRGGKGLGRHFAVTDPEDQPVPSVGVCA